MSNLSNIASAIHTQHDYFLEHILERPFVFLLRKLRSGTRCTSCWDEINQERSKSRCDACYDVGYAGGYATPEKIFISFTEPAYQTSYEVNDTEDRQAPPTQAWANGAIVIKSEDIIADEEGKFFRVLSSQPTTISGEIYLRQMLSIQLIPSTDIIYSYALPSRTPVGPEEEG